MGLLLREGVAQDRQAAGTRTEQTQPNRKGTLVQRRNRRLIGLDTGPVDVGMIWRLHQVFNGNRFHIMRARSDSQGARAESPASLKGFSLIRLL